MKAMAVALVLGLTLNSGAVAQTVMGAVLRTEGRSPVAGAFVTLLDGYGSTRSGVITDSLGRFVLKPPRPGTYMLRAEMIGHATVESDTFSSGSGSVVRLDLLIPVQAVTLQAITAESSGRCELRPDIGARTHTLWEEVRKALNLASWSSKQGYRFRTVTYHSAFDKAGRRRKREEPDTAMAYGPRPFVTPTAAELDREGYVRQSGESYTYYAPDPDVLLSDEFLDGHCFHVVDGGKNREHLVGLAFEPVSPREVADIAGVLWLDRSTASLESLEYRYTQLPWAVPLSDFGGRLEFLELPNGGWIVQRWQLRFPRMMRLRSHVLGHTTETNLRPDGYELVGGEVVGIRAPQGMPVALPGVSTVAGAVFDSTRMQPLRGAVVWLDEAFSARTDSRGRFVIEGASGDSAKITFTHPRADSLGVEPHSWPVALRPGTVTETRLSLPSLTTIWANACVESDRGIMVGRVTEATSGDPLPGVLLTLGAGGDAAVPLDSVATDADGIFRFCSVPPGSSLTLTSKIAGLSATEPVVQSGSIQRRDMELKVMTGSRIAGRVLDRSGAVPIVGAQVRLPQIRQTTTTDSVGAFHFASVPAGRQPLEVQHLGFGTAVDTLDVSPASSLSLDIILGADPVTLAPIEVRASSRPLLAEGGLQDYETRREHFSRLGLGRFIEREEIEQRQATRVFDVLRGMAGVRVLKSGMGGSSYVVRMSRASGGLFSSAGGSVADQDAAGAAGGSGAESGSSRGCPPKLYVDGIKVAGADEFLQSFSASELHGLEVYSGTAQVPAEFGGSDAQCGVIALWTRRGR